MPDIAQEEMDTDAAEKTSYDKTEHEILVKVNDGFSEVLRNVLEIQ